MALFDNHRNRSDYDQAVRDVEQNGERAASRSLELTRTMARQAGSDGNRARAALQKHKLPSS